MKTKLLLIFIVLFCLKGWAITLQDFISTIPLRKQLKPKPYVEQSNPPTRDKCTIFANVLNISLDRTEEHITIIVMNNITGEVVHSQLYFNTKYITLDVSLYDRGEYAINIILNDCSLEGEFCVK